MPGVSSAIPGFFIYMRWSIIRNIQSFKYQPIV